LPRQTGEDDQAIANAAVIVIIVANTSVGVRRNPAALPCM
jgi:hypothetical protein